MTPVMDPQNGRFGAPNVPVFCGGSCQTNYSFQANGAYCGTHACGVFNTQTCDNSCNVPTSCTFYPSNMVQALGTCGMPGGGGMSGGPGGGGGASVALVISAGASANLVGTSLVAQNGGDGAVGGPGGSGGPGAFGAPAYCTQPVCGGLPNCPTVNGYQLSANPGGRGGDGAPGPMGGAGAGGPAYGIVTLGSAAFVKDAASTIVVGNGGKAGPGASDGIAAATAAF